jgi:predicted negative regulator of RcsB-dependent stress response
LFNNDFQVWAKYTESLDRTASFDRLAKVADSMAEIFPSNPTVELIATKGYMGIGNWQVATEHCENGLTYALDEDIIVALKSSLARILNSQSYKDKAYSILNELNSAYPQNANVMNELAKIFALNKEQELKSQDWNAKALASSYSPEFMFTKGFIAYQFLHFTDAIQSLETAVKDDPQGQYLELLGDAWFSNGNAKEAQKYWQQAWSQGYHSNTIFSKITKAKP